MSDRQLEEIEIMADWVVNQSLSFRLPEERREVVGVHVTFTELLFECPDEPVDRE